MDCCPYHNAQLRATFRPCGLEHKAEQRRVLFNESYNDCLQLLTPKQRARLRHGTMIATLQRAWHLTRSVAKRDRFDLLIRAMSWNGFE